VPDGAGSISLEELGEVDDGRATGAGGIHAVQVLRAMRETSMRKGPEGPSARSNTSRSCSTNCQQGSLRGLGDSEGEVVSGALISSIRPMAPILPER
jgi:hypothetical protein